ncbi:hypothetical protein KZ810_05740 [Sphingomonas sp. RHCKR47]|uniref:hypothetical protein n=1 Tax=Sphingomonas citricola TaxID=2862498 RepID=UPI001CA5625D|nr:hypothetical protein [Sphingomonas citricola]MBW6522993.1 hypothetical protein [Sphingomonas citricola]
MPVWLMAAPRDAWPDADIEGATGLRVRGLAPFGFATEACRGGVVCVLAVAVVVSATLGEAAGIGMSWWCCAAAVDGSSAPAAQAASRVGRYMGNSGRGKRVSRARVRPGGYAVFGGGGVGRGASPGASETTRAGRARDGGGIEPSSRAPISMSGGMQPRQSWPPPRAP